MFSKVRRRLTWFNSLLTGLFLLIFACVTYIGLIWSVYSQETYDILVYAREEADEKIEIFKKKAFFPENEPNESLFFYVFDRHGKRVAYSLPQPGLRQPVAKIMLNDELQYTKPVLFSFKVGKHHQRIIMTVVRLQDGLKFYGKIYVGKNVTELYLIFQRLLYLFAIMPLIFLFFSAFLGSIMAVEAMQPIQRSFQRQREFIADASHELRTPLGVLMASVDAIQGDNSNQITPFSRQVLMDMRDEIKKMTRIVGDLMTLARSDAAVLNLMKEQFDLIAVAQQTLRTLAPLAEAKGIDLQMQISEQLNLYADRERIAQLLLILLDNAVKYTPQNGIVKLSIQPSVKDSTIELVVADTGVGIAPQEHALIFERFYRVDKARERQNGGAGLGLPIAKWIAEQHGGSIKVISQPGKGSSFVVMLPCLI